MLFQSQVNKNIHECEMDDYDTFQRLLLAGMAGQGGHLPDRDIRLMNIHRTLLTKWNKKINLTRITGIRDVVEKHYIDSLYGRPFFTSPYRVLDMGSGGGFPGVPIAVTTPGLIMTLVDSSLKKINFLKQVIRNLDLDNIHAIHSRIQDLSNETMHFRNYDVVISRAFSRLDQFIELGMPFLTPTGFLLAFKSGKGAQETTLLNPSRFTSEICEFCLPFSKARRCIIKITPIS